MLTQELDELPHITYHPRKPMAYLQAHPQSNRIGTTEGFSFLTPAQIDELAKTREIFPPKTFGCFQISLMADGNVYGCCEGIRPLGTIHDDIKQLINTLEQRIQEDNQKFSEKNCGCCEIQFKCGMKTPTNH